MYLILLSISDQGGWTVALVGYACVFVALVLLVVVFTNIPKLLQIKIREKLKKQGKASAHFEDLSVEGNVNAAIAMALYLHFNEMHDEESNIITIKKITKNYSPWSSKIYGVSNNQLRK